MKQHHTQPGRNPERNLPARNGFTTAPRTRRGSLFSGTGVLLTALTIFGSALLANAQTGTHIHFGSASTAAPQNELVNYGGAGNGGYANWGVTASNGVSLPGVTFTGFNGIAAAGFAQIRQVAPLSNSTTDTYYTTPSGGNYIHFPEKNTGVIIGGIPMLADAGARNFSIGFGIAGMGNGNSGNAANLEDIVFDYQDASGTWINIPTTTFTTNGSAVNIVWRFYETPTVSSTNLPANLALRIYRKNTNGSKALAIDDIRISSTPPVVLCNAITYNPAMPVTPVNTFRWVGAGTGTGNNGSEFDNPNNWCPQPTPANPLANGHLQLYLTSAARITMDASFTAATLDATISGIDNDLVLDLSGQTLTVTGNLTANVASGNANTDLEIRTRSGALIVGGTAAIGNTSVTGKVGFGSSANEGSLTFNGPLVLGQQAGVYTTMPGTVSVKGNFTHNSALLGASGFAGSTVSFNGMAAQSILGTQPVTFANLAISNAAGVTSTTVVLNVTGNLNMTSGQLATSAQRPVQLGAAATLTETETAYITGNLHVTRTISTSAQTFGGAGLSITAGSGPYATTVIRQTGTPRTGASFMVDNTSVPSQSIARVFTISVAGAPADLNAALTFHFWDHELNGFAAEELIFFRENPAAAGNWIYKGKDAGVTLPTETTAGSITKSGIKAFSTWTLGSSLNPLPVSLVQYTAKRKADAALLEWQTASEENNAGYQIEASSDNRNFTKLAFVAAAETGHYGARYSYTDEGASRYGTRYYRLSQHDLDGTATVLGVRTVSFGAGAALAVGPNPFRTGFTAMLESDRVQQATLTLTDALGRVIVCQVVQLEKGANAVPFLNDALTNGLYVLGVQLEDKMLSARITRQ